MKKNLKFLIYIFIVIMLFPVKVYMAEFDETYYQNTEPVDWSVDAIAARVATNGATEVIKKQTDRVIGEWNKKFTLRFGPYVSGRVSGTDEQILAYMWIDKEYKSRDIVDKASWNKEEILDFCRTRGLEALKEQDQTVVRNWQLTFKSYGWDKTYEWEYDLILQAMGSEANLSLIENMTPGSVGSNTKIKTLAGKVLGVIQTLGSVCSVIALVIIGLKYMYGSIEEKAKYKETMLPYIVGCILVFTIINIASIIYEVGINL